MQHKKSTADSVNFKEVLAEVKVMLTRLEEIKAMDKSSLKSSKKREVRKEVCVVKADLKATGNRVYLSIGAIILIMLLLIFFYNIIGI